MTESAERVITSFEALPDAEKREVIAAVLRKAVSLSYEPMTDEELLATAEEVFLALDSSEGEK